jgi:hypothetical protein
MPAATAFTRVPTPWEGLVGGLIPSGATGFVALSNGLVLAVHFQLKLCADSSEAGFHPIYAVKVHVERCDSGVDVLGLELLKIATALPGRRV